MRECKIPLENSCLLCLRFTGRRFSGAGERRGWATVPRSAKIASGNRHEELDKGGRQGHWGGRHRGDTLLRPPWGGFLVQEGRPEGRGERRPGLEGRPWAGVGIPHPAH